MNNKIIDLIFNSIKSEGGDGDALWLSKYTSLENIITLLKKYNKENNIDWEIIEKENYILWGLDQEWATITTDKELYDSEPSWRVLKIIY